MLLSDRGASWFISLLTQTGFLEGSISMELPYTSIFLKIGTLIGLGFTKSARLVGQ